MCLSFPSKGKINQANHLKKGQGWKSYSFCNAFTSFWWLLRAFPLAFPQWPGKFASRQMHGNTAQDSTDPFPDTASQLASTSSHVCQTWFCTSVNSQGCPWCCPVQEQLPIEQLRTPAYWAKSDSWIAGTRNSNHYSCANGLHRVSSCPLAVEGMWVNQENLSHWVHLPVNHYLFFCCIFLLVI